MGTKLLCTGSTGFVASHVIDALKVGAPDVKCLFTSASGQSGTLKLDIRDADAVESTVASFKPTHVLHLAGQSSLEGAAGGPVEAWDINFQGTHNLASAVRRNAPGCVFVFSSTAQVYGRAFLQAEPVTESTLTGPEGTYARTKMAAEYMLQDVLGREASLVVLRLFNNIGPGQDRRFAIPSFCAQIAEIELGKKEPTLRVGNLSARRDFLDVRDVAQAILSVLRKPDIGAGSQTFNIASGHLASVGDLLDHLVSRARKSIEVIADPALFRSVDVEKTLASGEQFTAAYGWTPSYPISQTLDDTMAFWRQRIVA